MDCNPLHKLYPQLSYSRHYCHVFVVAAPRMSNNLLFNIRSVPTVTVIKSREFSVFTDIFMLAFWSFKVDVDVFFCFFRCMLVLCLLCNCVLSIIIAYLLYLIIDCLHHIINVSAWIFPTFMRPESTTALPSEVMETYFLFFLIWHLKEMMMALPSQYTVH